MFIALLVLSFLLGTVAMGLFGVASMQRQEREHEDKLQEAWSRAIKQGELFGRVRLDAYRVVGHPAFRAYLQDCLSGTTVSEAISHITEIGLRRFMLDVQEYVHHNVYSPELARAVQDLADMYDREVIIDGVVFSRYTMTPDLYNVIYHDGRCMIPCADPCGKVIPQCPGRSY